MYIAEKVLMLQNREIEQVKVQWKHFRPDEAIWEIIDQMWAIYPSLFSRLGKVVLVWCLVYVFAICFGTCLVMF